MDKNNFDGVRIALALTVFFAHLATLTQLSSFQFFNSIFNADFAVKGFFAISGFLVMKSYHSSHNIREYLEKRVRRIYPGYFVVIIVCLLIGAFVSSLSLSNFMLSSITLKYLLSNLLLLNFLQPTLPGVFDANPLPTLNGSLWTIKVEVMLYACLPFVAWFFKKWGSLISSLVLFFLSVCWVYYFIHIYSGGKGEEIARQFPGQLSYFVIGSLFSVNQKILANIKYLAMASLLMLIFIKSPSARLVIEPLAFTCLVIYLSTSAVRNLGLGRYGDISFGVYLYHFPIIQLLIFLNVFALNAWLGLALALVLTLAAALLSWHFIEKKCLKRSSHYIAASSSSHLAITASVNSKHAQ
ncbi:acyltransferase [Neisseriaceae bacterium TC5R-5]|nr:acyltransferase [Neisseriaceae bacterium TC5R-5]